MAFANPFTGTPAQVSELDFFSWPCISGEKYPPVFANGNGSAAYSSATVWPSIHIQNSGNLLTSSTWPTVPAYSPRYGTFTGYTVSFQFATTTIASVGRFWTMQDTAGAWSCQVTLLAGAATYRVDLTIGGNNVATVIPVSTAWHSVVLSQSPSGARKAVLDGVTNNIVAGAAPSSAFAMQFSAADSTLSGITADISNLRLSYTPS